MSDIPAQIAPPDEEWIVELCDSGFNRLHEVIAGTFTGVIRRNEPGQWLVDVPMEELGDELCCPNANLVGGVRVTRNGQTVFAGWVSRLSSGGGMTRTVAANERRMTFEGVDAWHPLTTRLIYPDPLTEFPWAASYDVRAGVGSTVAAGFVSDNLGATALPDRVWPDLVIADSTVGNAGSWSGRLQTLSALVGRIADESLMVCRPTVDAQRRPVIRFQQPKDLTGSLVFSDQGELSDVSVSSSPAASTWVLAAGDGEGTARQFASAGSPLGAERVERVTEQTNATTTAELAQVAEVIRRDEGVALHVDGQVTALAARVYPFGISYDIGDVVSVQVGGSRFPLPVTSVRVEVNPERAAATPVLGTFTPDRLQGLRRDVLGLADRFNSNIS
jgi:hypothetical protein